MNSCDIDTARNNKQHEDSKMSIHTKITVIPTPGGVPEDLAEHPDATMVDAFEWITKTLSTRDGVVLLRMWFGEQWGGQKTMIRTIGSRAETLEALRIEFSHAWSAWEERHHRKERDWTCGPGRSNSEYARPSHRSYFHRLTDSAVAVGL